MLHCLETIGSGGVEQTRYSLSRHLDREGFEQMIVCTQELGILPGKMRENGVAVEAIGLVPYPFHPGRVRSVLRVIARYRPHIIHGAVFEGVTLAAVAGRLGHVPGVIVEETHDPVDRNWKGHLLMRGLSAMADRVIAVSPTVGDYVRNTLHIQEPRLRIVNNGVELQEEEPGEAVAHLRASLGIGPGETVIGSVGRLLDAHKRFSDLIRAMALLKKDGLRPRLLLVGDGPDRAMLEGLSRDLEVEDLVVFAGYQGNTRPYYQCMDLFALASAMEAFGLVAAEAMLCRLPVVASSVGGLRDVVREGETGFLVEPLSPPAFAEAIRGLLADPLLRKQMGDAGYRRALSEYTGAAYAGRIAAVYSDLYREKSKA